MQASVRLRVWGVFARRHPSAFLLAAQLASLLLYPLMDDSQGGRLLFGGLTLVVVPLALWVVTRSPLVNWIGWLLAIPAMALTAFGVAFEHRALLPLSALLEAALYFYAAGGLIAYMLRDHKVTTDELYAAAATFTLLAWGFAYAYMVCQIWYPGSFTGFEPQRSRSWMELLFYSFTNLSATGLGDVLPASSRARVLTMLEQFAGVGYVATVVSRLIGLTIVRAER
ncbi:MAG: two pore domain potassium channel family protein [Gammaproteobacteria bacterium]|nr:two pore domain potassium channel family protein [Gammaproteobacteria bacterium]